MDHYELPYAKIIILHDNISEVMINEEVKMDLEMVEHYHEFLLSHLRSVFRYSLIKSTPTHPDRMMTAGDT